LQARAETQPLARAAGAPTKPAPGVMPTCEEDFVSFFSSQRGEEQGQRNAPIQQGYQSRGRRPSICGCRCCLNGGDVSRSTKESEEALGGGQGRKDEKTHKSIPHQVRPPIDAVMLVTMAPWTERRFMAASEPPLNPNHPNQIKQVPRTTCETE
jgi:hypothetical protein